MTPSSKKQIITLRIIDLELQAIIGVNERERHKKQDIVINVTLQYDAARAITTDNIKAGLDYKAIKLSIIRLVQSSPVLLLEKLAAQVLALVMKDRRVLWAKVRIDKPFALRFARSVSAEIEGSRKFRIRIP